MATSAQHLEAYIENEVIRFRGVGRVPGKKWRMPITFSYPLLALPKAQAAKAIGIGHTKLWELCATGKIKSTPYGTIPIAELERHLKAEVSQ